MQGFQITFFIIFTCIFSTQAIRHVHNYAFGYDEPVIASVEQNYGMQQAIRQEGSVEELLAEYEDIQKQIRELSDANPAMAIYARQQAHPELYARSNALRKELTQRQNMSLELRDIWIYSGAGYILIALGSVLYLRGHNWVGMSLVLPGFTELAWWSAPSFTIGGAVQEYELLLTNKIILTMIAIALIYTVWFFSMRSKVAA